MAEEKSIKLAANIFGQGSDMEGGYLPDKGWDNLKKETDEGYRAKGTGDYGFQSVYGDDYESAEDIEALLDKYEGIQVYPYSNPAAQDFLQKADPNIYERFNLENDKEGARTIFLRKRPLLMSEASDEEVAVSSQNKAPKGLIEPGNITDLSERPVVDLGDGRKGTIRSFSIEEDGKEVLIPQIVGGKLLSREQAVDHYLKTQEHLGKFDSPANADEYGKSLSDKQGERSDVKAPIIESEMPIMDYDFDGPEVTEEQPMFDWVTAGDMSPHETAAARTKASVKNRKEGATSKALDIIGAGLGHEVVRLATLPMRMVDAAKEGPGEGMSNVAGEFAGTALTMMIGPPGKSGGGLRSSVGARPSIEEQGLDQYRRALRSYEETSHIRAPQPERVRPLSDGTPSRNFEATFPEELPPGSIERAGLNTFNRELSRSPADGTFRERPAEFARFWGEDRNADWDAFTSQLTRRPREPEAERLPPPVGTWDNPVGWEGVSGGARDNWGPLQLDAVPYNIAADEAAYYGKMLNDPGNSKLEAKEFKSLTEISQRNPKKAIFVYQTKEGKWGDVTVEYLEDKKRLWVDWIGRVGQRWSVSPREGLELMKLFKERFPEAEKIGGERVSGVRAKMMAKDKIQWIPMTDEYIELMEGMVNAK